MASNVTPKVKSVKVKPTKQNNLLSEETESDVANSFRYLFYIQAVLGINRFYLLKCAKPVRWIFNIYSCTIILLHFSHTIIINRSLSTSYFILNYVSCFEFILLIINSILFKKKTYRKLTDNMNKFDEHLKINKDLNILSPSYRSIVWMIASLVYGLMEYLAVIYFILRHDTYTILLGDIQFMAHDSELVFLCGIIRMILLRLCVLKAHINKKFGERDGKELNKLDSLSKKCELDTIQMHRMYELLHKCAEQLNTVMSFPMSILLFCSGVATTFLLRTAFFVMRDDTINPTMKLLIVIYCLVRCIRYTSMVLFSCYLPTMTATQVAHIRTTLHDAINSGRIKDKFERRQVKAFFQLTRESEFEYALWGVIGLNMSLPLSYSSLCLTYLIIIIQFSKFID